MNKLELISSLNDLRMKLKNLPEFDTVSLHSAKLREPNLTKPPGSLGRLEKIAAWLSSWQGKHPPSVDFPSARIFAGNHGISKNGVSAYPSEVTEQMVDNFNSGGAAINQLCATFKVELDVLPINIKNPTHDFTQKPAMSENAFIDTINIGLKSVEKKTDVLCLGEMGIGNTASAAALCHAVFGSEAELWTGLGTGIDNETYRRKVELVEKGVRLHQPFINDGLDALIRLGGFEFGAIAGAIVAARFLQIPVILDGFVSSTAAAMLAATQKGSLDHCLVAHMSQEVGHKKLLFEINKTPLLDLDMRLGEASGAVLSVGILKAAVNCHNGMSTFKEAGITNKN